MYKQLRNKQLKQNTMQNTHAQLVSNVAYNKATSKAILKAYYAAQYTLYTTYAANESANSLMSAVNAFLAQQFSNYKIARKYTYKPANYVLTAIQYYLD